jgi:hypothetical protein
VRLQTKPLRHSVCALERGLREAQDLLARRERVLRSLRSFWSGRRRRWQPRCAIVRISP